MAALLGAFGGVGTGLALTALLLAPPDPGPGRSPTSAVAVPPPATAVPSLVVTAPASPTRRPPAAVPSASPGGPVAPAPPVPGAPAPAPARPDDPGPGPSSLPSSPGPDPVEGRPDPAESRAGSRAGEGRLRPGRPAESSGPGREGSPTPAPKATGPVAPERGSGRATVPDGGAAEDGTAPGVDTEAGGGKAVEQAADGAVPYLAAPRDPRSQVLSLGSGLLLMGLGLGYLGWRLRRW